MTDAVAVLEAMTEAQEQVVAGETWALAVGDAGRWASPHYWNDPLQREVFEAFVAHECAAKPAVVFVTPVIVVEADRRLDFRDPRETPRPGEREELFGLAINAKTGFDVLRCQITRPLNGPPTFGDVEIFEGKLQLTPDTPGFLLLQNLLNPSDDSGSHKMES